MSTLASVIGRGVVASRPAAGEAGALYFATDVSGGTLQRDNGSSWDTVEAASDGAIAATAYGPDTEFLTAGAATSLTAIDTTNLRLAVPSSFAGGTIFVRLSCLAEMNTAGNGYWGLKEGGTTVALGWVTNDGGTIDRYTITFRLTGVTSGAHNYDWAYQVSAGSINMWGSPLTGGTNKWGQALMEAWIGV